MKFRFFARINAYDYLILKTIVQNQESISTQQLYSMVSKWHKKLFPENGEPPKKSYFYQRATFLQDHELIIKTGKPIIFQLYKTNKQKVIRYLGACTDLVEW